MLHQFCPVVAKDFGVNTAIFLQNLAFWTQTNLANVKNIHDGYCWTYNTLDAFTEIFPYFTKKQMRTIIDNALKDGLIIKGNYNQTKYDRTLWYALTPKAYQYFNQLVNPKYLNLLGEAFNAICPKGQIEMLERTNRNDAKGTPIPDNKPDNKTDIIIGESKDSLAIGFVNQVIDAYHDELPEMPKIKLVTNEVKKAVKVLEKEWVNIKGEKITIEAIRRYFVGRRKLTPWILEPYQTKDGNLRRSRLINIIRIDNVRKFYNGDYTNV